MAASQINGGADLTTSVAYLRTGSANGDVFETLRLTNIHATLAGAADVWIDDGSGAVVTRLCKNFSVAAGDARDLGRWRLKSGQRLCVQGSAASTLHLGFSGIAA